ncbi:MAG: cytochrome P450 [Idiomarinaceae bacterium HL-53]|nr:MAG: cytochrome P450 [Idiomarinaceae bacterium HL-53]CUS47101.1 Cytochrome P450 [Idiomarinaceae bacterium HL-53]
MNLSQAKKIITSARYYAEPELLYAAGAFLREQPGLVHVESEHYRPFWFVGKHASIQAVERNSSLFLNAPRAILTRQDVEQAIRNKQQADKPALRTLVHMDAPDHSLYRKLIQPFFSVARLKACEADIEHIVNEVLNSVEQHNKFDVCHAITCRIPLRVLCSLLGLPPAYEADLLKLTQGLFSPEDPERALANNPPKAFLTAVQGFSELLMPQLVRETFPEGSLLHTLLGAEVNGRAIGHWEKFSLIVLLLTGGHDTTAFSMAAGIEALLKGEMVGGVDLDKRVNETLRWATPVRSFMRTAAENCEIEGTSIQKGESVLLFYPAANRDPRVFEQPNTFYPSRTVNPQLSFGVGPHVCIGSVLAKLELKALFKVLQERKWVLAQTGPVRYTQSVFVGGIASLPVRRLP